MVRTRDIVVGGTYLVCVPYRLPAARYPDRFRPGTAQFAASWLTGGMFRFTVTEIDVSADPPTVTGLRISDTTRIDEVELTDTQVASLGLPNGRYLLIGGTLVDDQHHLVALPQVAALEVPARWLRPITDDPPLTHWDADRTGF